MDYHNARMGRIYLFLLFAFLASLVASASAPTFCKCTCFTNSTIIPLGPHKQAPGSSPVKDPSNNNGASSGSGSKAGDNGASAPSSSSSSSTSSTSSSASGAEQTTISRSPTDDFSFSPQPEPDPLDDTVFLDATTGARVSPVSRRAASSSCTQCNRAFCLTYNLPICKGAEEKDVLTSCFQRDSRKDQIIVWGFILGTAGLLGWAGVKRALEMREGTTVIPGLTGIGSSRPGSRGNGRTMGGLGGSGEPGRTRGIFNRRVGSSGGGGGASESEDVAARGVYSPLGNLDG